MPKLAVVLLAATDHREGVPRRRRRREGHLRRRGYGVEDAVEEAGIAFADDFRDHPSVRALVTDGYQVVTS